MIVDKSLILNRLKKHLKIGTDKEFAEFLEIKPTTLSMWHKRNTMDIELIFTKCDFLNAEWLLTGEGEMLKENTKPPEKKVMDERDSYIIELQKKLIQDQEEKIKTLSKNLSKLKKAQESNPDLFKVAESNPKLKR